MINFSFRGYSTNDGRPVIGDLVHKGDSTAILVPGTTTAVPCIPESITQDTGLRDADGNAVFEGDILENSEGHRIVIIREAAAPTFAGLSPMALARGKTSLCSSAHYLAKNAGQMRVVGNMHESPELIQCHTS